MLKAAFRSQKSSALRRDVGFFLTFDQWLRIWVESGHLDARGCGRGRYCMARHGDQGPYVVGNVKIITFEQNCVERIASLETRAKMSKARAGRTPFLGKRFTQEQRKKISRSLVGRKLSAETRAKIAKANIGKTHTLASKEKMRTAKLGNNYAVRGRL